MKPKDIFSLAIRLLGLVFLYLAVKSIAPVWFAPTALIPTILTGACYLAAAWWLLGGAQILMRRAYPDTAMEPESGAEVSGAFSAKAGL